MFLAVDNGSQAVVMLEAAYKVADKGKSGLFFIHCYCTPAAGEYLKENFKVEITNCLSMIIISVR